MTTAMKAQKLDLPAIKKIHAEMDEALKPVFKKHNLDVGRGSKISYGLQNFKFSVEAGLVVDGNVETKEARAYRQFADVYGMDPSWLFKKIRLFTDDIVMIVGINTRAHKMPILAEKSDGKTYKFKTSAFKGARLVK